MGGKAKSRCHWGMPVGHAKGKKCKQIEAQLSQYNEIRKLWPHRGMFK